MGQVKRPVLAIHGWCVVCEAFVPLKKNILAKHQNSASGQICKNSGYSSFQSKYVITDQAQAKQVAEFIQTDNFNDCFDRLGRHSLTCGNGYHCGLERLKIAKALADFFLS